MLRCIGDAEDGAVLVDGGAEYVILPRLPNEPPLPARASASPGESARTRAAAPAIRLRVRGISIRFEVDACLIWGVPKSKARGSPADPLFVAGESPSEPSP